MVLFLLFQNNVKRQTTEYFKQDSKECIVVILMNLTDVHVL